MDIAVVDIETTSINPRIPFKIENDIICEIGIVKLNINTGKITPLFNSVCQEDACGSPKSWIFHHSDLTHSEVTQAPHINDLKNEIQSIFNEYTVTAWNQAFDFPRLEHHSRGLKITNKYWDPMIVLTNLIKIPHPSRSGYKWPSVSDAWKYFNPNKKFFHPHRAIQDATVEAQLTYQAVIKWPELMDKQEK
ncbi:MAG: 3'-5' exonuclease [Candidatus Bathyarchaeia archaeon]